MTDAQRAGCLILSIVAAIAAVVSIVVVAIWSW